MSLLRGHHIEAVADVRRFPSSRMFPHFNRKPLAERLQKSGIEYHWFEALGGRRLKAPQLSQNRGLRVAGFRHYADYMRTPEFKAAVWELIELAGRKRTAVMCAEKLYWQCHRRILSDYLTAQSCHVVHIFETDSLREHALTDTAIITEDHEVIYPPGGDEELPLFEK